MRRIVALVLFSALIPTFAFADTDSVECETIAKACVDAGYTERDGLDKAFWQDCMKQVLFNKEVNGVTVEPKTSKACRKFKIKNMQEQIIALKKVK